MLYYYLSRPLHAVALPPPSPLSAWRSPWTRPSPVHGATGVKLNDGQDRLDYLVGVIQQVIVTPFRCGALGCVVVYMTPRVYCARDDVQRITRITRITRIMTCSTRRCAGTPHGCWTTLCMPCGTPLLIHLFSSRGPCEGHWEGLRW